MMQIIIGIITDDERQKELSSEVILPDGSKQFRYKPKLLRKDLDIYDEFEISLNFLVSDVADPLQKRSSYSKTITIPDTARNRETFDNISESSLNGQFNLKTRTRCWVIQNSITVFDGYLKAARFKSITSGDDNTDTNEIEITLVSPPITFMSEISDLKLRDLTYPVSKIPYTHEEIVKTWEDFKKGTATYFFPVMDRGWNLSIEKCLSQYYTILGLDIPTNPSYGLWVENFYPGFMLKTYWDAIFARSGWKWKSNFITSDFFGKLNIPYSGARNALKADISYKDDQIATFAYDKYFCVGISGETAYGPSQAIPRVSSTNEWEYPLRFNKETDPVSDFYTDRNNLWEITADGKMHHFRGNSVYTDPYKQRFVIGLKVYINPVGLPSTTTIRDWTKTLFGQIEKIFINVHRDGITSTYPFDAPSYRGYSIYDGKWEPTLCIYDKAGDLETVGEFENIENYDDPSSRYGFKIYLEMPWFDNASYNPVESRGYIKPGERVRFSIAFRMAPYVSAAPSFFLDAESYLRNDVSLDVIHGSKFDVSEIVPDMTCSDLIDSIVKAFNLYVEADKDDDKLLIIEPRDDFYAGGKVLDWTDKVDVSDVIESKFIADDNKYFKMEFKNDRDNLSLNYTSYYSETYGTKLYDTGNYYNNSESKISLPFATSPLFRIYNKSLSTSMVWTSLVENYNETRYTGFPNMNFKATAPRLLFVDLISHDPGSTTRPYKFGINTKIKLDGTVATRYKYDYYPYAGEILFDKTASDPFKKGLFQLNYDSPKAQYWTNNLTHTTNNNLFNTFWKNSIEDITSRESRLITAYINLTPQDIYEFSFRNIVFIRFNEIGLNLNGGGFFVVNSITDYNPSIEKSCKVELLLLRSNSVNISNIPKTGFGTPPTAPGGGSSTKGAGGEVVGVPRPVGGSFIGVPAESGILGAWGSGGIMHDATLRTSSVILGEDATVGGETAIVLGDRAWSAWGVKDVVLLGSDARAESSYGVWTAAPIIQNANLIEAGYDKVLDPFDVSPINIISGGRDVVRDIDSINAVSIIDAGRINAEEI